jgi:hypothetical protein
MGRFVGTTVRCVVAVILMVTATAAACQPPPPPPPAPTLPFGTGVAWWKDAGGTIEDVPFVGPTYRPAFERWVTLDGTTTGPTPVSALTPFPATFWGALGFDLGAATLPNGTAMFPWNGFAGEGISASTTPLSIEVAFPGGSCSIPATMGLQIGGLTPSPDGTKAAFVGRDISGFGGFTVAWVDVLSLEPDGDCPSIVRWDVDYSPSDPADHPTSGLVVWSPDSSAIVYSISQDAQAQSIVRLDATTAATPSTILAASAGCWLPLGWSIDDRVLVSCHNTTGSPPRVSSTLETMSAAGGPRRLVDGAGSAAITTSTASSYLYHYGYFVPGTSTIAYSDGSQAFTTSSGAVPRFRLRLRNDATGAEAPLTGSEPPLSTHEEPLLSAPNTTVSIPDLVLVESFVR